MVATRAQRSAAAARAALSPEVRRALQSEDVLACVLSLYAVKDGCVHSVASVSKAWRAAWRRRCKGRWRLLRTQIGDFRHAIHVTALATGGAIVADYGHFKLQAFSPDGDSQTIYCERFETPGAIALLGDGTAWMLAQDREAVCLVRWQDDVGALQPSHRWPNGWNHDGNWNDPYGRILQHVDFNALGASEEPRVYLEPCDLAVSGDRLLVLCRGSLFGRICVLDSQTGALLYQIGPAREAGEADELRVPRSLAVHQDLCFVADTCNHAIKIFNFRQRELVRTIGSTAAAPTFLTMRDSDDDEVDQYYIMSGCEDARRSDLPCEFDQPVGVAFQDGRLYVSEWGNRRIQILRFVDGIHGAVECLQIIQSPYGMPLAGLCVSGERLWCVGQRRGRIDSMMPSTDGCLYLFTACV